MTSELVAALLRDVANPYAAANGGIPMIIELVRATLGDTAAASVRITVH